MRKIRETLRLHFDHRLSQRKIARSVGIGQPTVHDYLCRFTSSGLVWPLPPELTDEALEAQLYPEPVTPAAADRPMPDFAALQEELRRHKHTTLHLLWSEYRAVQPDGYSYSRFCRLYDDWRTRQSPVMRQVHKAGEKLFVDWAGMKIPLHDRHTGEIRHASLFVAVLGASLYTYAEATLTEQLADWIGAHTRAFRFFGGVAELLVPDNTKTAVTKPCRYDPDLNPTYYEMAGHYGCGVLPARVRKPRDKAVVEAGVLLAERWILAALRHRRFCSLAEINQAIGELLVRLNAHPFKKRPGSRISIFAEVEKPALRPLPDEPYDQSLWSRALVGLDYHVEHDGSFYSVPCALLRQTVEVRATPTTIEVFHRGQRVASHARAREANTAVTLSEHRPAAHRAQQDWSGERIQAWARQAGPAAEQLVEAILAQYPHPQMGLRACAGAMRLAERYPKERVSAAAERALRAGGGYKSFRSILERSLDQAPLDDGPPERLTPAHGNIRGAEYFGAAAPAEGC